jgi:hypothetical protein
MTRRIDAAFFSARLQPSSRLRRLIMVSGR